MVNTFLLGMSAGFLIQWALVRTLTVFLDARERRQQLRVEGWAWKENGDLLVRGWLGEGRNHWVSGRGSGTVWHFPDGRRCPAWLEEQFSEVWTTEKWKLEDANAR